MQKAGEDEITLLILWRCYEGSGCEDCYAKRRVKTGGREILRESQQTILVGLFTYVMYVFVQLVGSFSV